MLSSKFKYHILASLSTCTQQPCAGILQLLYTAKQEALVRDLSFVLPVGVVGSLFRGVGKSLEFYTSSKDGVS